MSPSVVWASRATAARVFAVVSERSTPTMTDVIGRSYAARPAARVLRTAGLIDALWFLSAFRTSAVHESDKNGGGRDQLAGCALWSPTWWSMTLVASSGSLASALVARSWESLPSATAWFSVSVALATSASATFWGSTLLAVAISLIDWPPL